MTIFHIIVSLTHIDGEDPHTLSVKHCQWYFSHFKYIGDIGASAWLCRHANIKWCSVSCSKLLTAAKTNNFQDFQVTRAKEMQANEHRQIIYHLKCCLVDNYQSPKESFNDHWHGHLTFTVNHYTSRWRWHKLDSLCFLYLHFCEWSQKHRFINYISEMFDNSKVWLFDAPECLANWWVF